MALLKLQQNDSLPDNKSSLSLTAKDLKSANDSVSNCNVKSTDRQSYNAYSAEERTQIGNYTCMLWRLAPPGPLSNSARF